MGTTDIGMSKQVMATKKHIRRKMGEGGLTQSRKDATAQSGLKELADGVEEFGNCRVRYRLSAFLSVGAGTKGDGCEFKRRQVIYLLYLSLGRGVEEA